MLKSWVRSAGTRVLPSTRQVCVVSASQFFSMVSGDSFQRKLFTGSVMRPFSMRKTPSRVRPVASASRGSSVRVYQKRVTSSPRFTPATSSSIEAALPPSRCQPPYAVGVLLLLGRPVTTVGERGELAAVDPGRSALARQAARSRRRGRRAGPASDGSERRVIEVAGDALAEADCRRRFLVSAERPSSTARASSGVARGSARRSPTAAGSRTTVYFPGASGRACAERVRLVAGGAHHGGRRRSSWARCAAATAQPEPRRVGRCARSSSARRRWSGWRRGGRRSP